MMGCMEYGIRNMKYGKNQGFVILSLLCPVKHFSGTENPVNKLEEIS